MNKQHFQQVSNVEQSGRHLFRCSSVVVHHYHHGNALEYISRMSRRLSPSLAITEWSSNIFARVEGWAYLSQKTIEWYTTRTWQIRMDNTCSWECWPSLAWSSVPLDQPSQMMVLTCTKSSLPTWWTRVSLNKWWASKLCNHHVHISHRNELLRWFLLEMSFWALKLPCIGFSQE